MMTPRPLGFLGPFRRYATEFRYSYDLACISELLSWGICDGLACGLWIVVYCVHKREIYTSFREKISDNSGGTCLHTILAHS